MEEKFTEKAKNWVLDKWDWAKWKAKTVSDWCKDHPKEALEIAGTAATVFIAGAKMHSSKKREQDRLNRVEEEHYLKACSIYDRKHGHHYYTNRPMTPSEQLEFDRRKDSGERIGWILTDMGLL